MNEEFEYTGLWWLPDQPETQVSGTLKFTPGEGAILELIGSFKDVKDAGILTTKEIILGTSANGKHITLIRCFETRSILNLSGLLVSAFHARTVLVDVHFQKTDAIKLKEISVHFSHLDEWVNISGLNIQLKAKAKEILIRYNYPAPIEVTLKDGCNISVYTQTTLPSFSFAQKEASIKEIKYIQISYPEEKSLDEYLKLLHKIRNFLSLGVLKPVYPLAIEATTDANKEMIKDKPYYPAVKVFYAIQGIPKVPDESPPFNMLFTFGDISDKFGPFLTNWLEKAELLEPVFDLYFGTLYNPRMYLNQTFLSLIQAAESYHRRMMNNYEIPEEKHKERLEEVISKFSGKNKKWLNRKLAYSNEPDLQRRLIEIWGKFPVVPDNLIGDKEFFIDKVVATRNYLTHYDSRLKGKAATGEDLYRLSKQLKALLEMCLLNELGFSSDKIREIFARNTRYRYELESFRQSKKSNH